MIYDVGGSGDYLQVGTVGRARGLKGHVRVRPSTDDPGRFMDLKRVWTTRGGAYAALEIIEAEVNGEAVVLRFTGVESREEAERLNGTALYVRREDAVKLPEGACFITDIIGASVYDDGGVFLGSLNAVLQPGAADVYVLHGGPKGEVMFPALKTVIISMDAPAKRIVVNAARFQEVAVFED